MLSPGNCSFNLTSCSFMLRPLLFFSQPNRSNAACSSLSGGSKMQGRMSTRYKNVSSHTFLNPMPVFSSWVRHLKGWGKELEEWSFEARCQHSPNENYIISKSNLKLKIHPGAIHLLYMLAVHSVYHIQMVGSAQIDFFQDFIFRFWILVLLWCTVDFLILHSVGTNHAVMHY